MSNLLIATQAAIRAATLTAGSAAPTMPAPNLALRSPSRVCRLLDLSAAWVQVDFGREIAVDVVATLYVLASSAARQRIRLAATAAALTTAPSYDSGLQLISTAQPLEHRGGAVHGPVVLPSRVIARYLRIDFTDTASTRGYLDIGALVAGPAYQPPNGYPLGWSIGLVDPSRRPRAEDGEVKPLPRGPYLSGRFTVDWLSEDDALGPVMDIQQQCGTTRPVLVIRDSSATGDKLERQTIYGTLPEISSLTNDQVLLYTTSFEIEELL